MAGCTTKSFRSVQGGFGEMDGDGDCRQVEQHLVKPRTLLGPPIDLHQGGPDANHHGLQDAQFRHADQNEQKADRQGSGYARKVDLQTGRKQRQQQVAYKLGGESNIGGGQGTKHRQQARRCNQANECSCDIPRTASISDLHGFSYRYNYR